MRSWGVLCPVCGRAKARRACPGLSQTICAVCCGTKRLTEIACPPDCAYLSTARQHPAAPVQRQQSRDVAVLLPTMRHLTERQQQLFFLFQTLIAQHKPDALARLTDADVAEATGTLAASLETAARGVIYDRQAGSAVAQKLADDLRGMLEHVRHQMGAPVGDLEAAAVLRAIEKGARQGGPGGAPTAYLEMMARLLQVNQASAPAKPGSSLVLP